MTSPSSDPRMLDDVVGACVQDPDRWMTATDDATKAICRGCPRRWLCARDAYETPGAEGLWAGIVIPEAGRGRTFALRQLKSLAERGGYPVRQKRRRSASPVTD
ncbi:MULTISPECIES: WhiB family transcriptional regulator [Mycobacterium]|uniref:Putative transcriptional regulator WhiB6 n=1 Tax=Mycobacterium talmoniae TaxID=1858794 RepID=A0A1S1NC93_9MYCO|nr:MULTISPECIES: WhiB family transcriptional regulator [Mycobacterium]OHU97019.1 transcription factor WhiB [Mycobacterium talmoniae]PQM49674.1 putative transcriptional regulator WhiB6 [Mycobacterium talmoniae]